MEFFGHVVFTAANYLLSAAFPPPYCPLFEYDALEPDCIRVLTLPPGRELDPISCEFRIISRDAAASSYSALSYCWGPESRAMETVTVCRVVAEDHKIIQDRRLLVLPNLHSAPVALRRVSAGVVLPLWIDAVCIDQANVAEKTKQVCHMDQIYASASNVIVWLGPAARDSDYAMDVMSGKIASEYTTRRFVTGVVALLGRPWFSRTWIVQEFILNRRAPLMACRSKRLIPWDDLREAYLAAVPLGQLFPVYSRPITPTSL